MSRKRILGHVRAAAALAFASLLSAVGTVRGQCTTNEQCADADFCTIDTCFIPGPNGQCVHSPRSCSDGQYCNGAEQCDEGRDVCEFACVGGTVCDGGFCACNQPDQCPGGNTGAACDILVQPPFCSPGQVCNENLDACAECAQNSHCAAPEPRCNTATGQCVQCFSNSHCTDSQHCNGQEACNMGTGFCEPGAPVECDFPQFCSELLDRCAECETDAQCSDGLYCNGVETCEKPDFVCQPGAAPNCKICVGGTNEGANCATTAECPGGVCRTFVCHEGSDSCVECLAHQDCVNSDLDWCTSDFCNELTHSCVHANDDGKCDDHRFCNGAERCVGGINNTQCNNTTGQGCCLFSCLGGTCSQFSCPAGSLPPCYRCVGGQDNGRTCHPSFGVVLPPLDDGIACTTDTCDENDDQADHTPSDAFCNDGIFCNGAEICDPAGESDAEGCVAGTPVVCSELQTECRDAFCSEPNDRCATIPVTTGTICDDDDPCSIVTQCSSSLRTCSNNDSITCTTSTQCPSRAFRCSNVDKFCTINADCPAGGTCSGAGTCTTGVCAVISPNANTTNSNYRCVRLEWRNVIPSTVAVNGIASADLYAVSDGCLYSGQTQCPSSQAWIQFLRALVDWNPQQIELLPSTLGNLNPEDPCNSTDPCFVCPVGQANWKESTWEPDCEGSGDAINAPCSGTPANDGDAKYVAVEPIPNPEGGCQTPPVCVPTSSSPSSGGLFVTRLKFRALRGGTALLGLEGCMGEQSTAGVFSKWPPPLGLNSNVLETVGAPAQIVVTCASNAECNDSNLCTTESCGGFVCRGGTNPGTACTSDANCTGGGVCRGTCTFQPVTGSCSNGLFCDGTNDMCVNGVCTGGASPCTDPQRPFCNEDGNGGAACTVADCCDQCRSVTDCVDTIGMPPVANACTDDSCTPTGDCVHTPVDCDDSVACTVDACNVVTGTAVCSHVPDDELCDTGLFCAAEYCDPQAGCSLNYPCAPTPGNPCPDSQSCQESSDTCGGCLPPAVAATGSRFIRVVPGAQGSTPVALLVEGDCDNANVDCLSLYVQSRCSGGPNDGQVCISPSDCPRVCQGGPTPGVTCVDTFPDCGSGGTCVGTCVKGRLDATPVFLTPAQWGTVQVNGSWIRPETDYAVFADCDFPTGRVLSAPSTARSFKWGDTTGDGLVNVIDIGTVVNGIKELWALATVEGTNLWSTAVPCDVDDRVNVLDLSLAVDALKGFPYPCVSLCP